MRVLFDHNIPSGAARAFVAHEVTGAIHRGWKRISNGPRIADAKEAGFDVLLTADKRIRYQQNLKGRRLAIIKINSMTDTEKLERIRQIYSESDGAGSVCHENPSTTGRIDR